MLLTNFEYYKHKYFGSRIPETSFNYLASKASAIADKVTLGRIKAIVENIPQPFEMETYLRVPESIQDCVCALSEILYKEENPQLRSHSAGGETQVYAVSDNSEALQENEITKVVHMYLDAELLYRGL